MAAVLPSAQSTLIDLLLKNDVPFSATPGAPEGGGFLASVGGLGGLIFPIALFAFFILPRLRGGQVRHLWKATCLDRPCLFSTGKEGTPADMPCAPFLVFRAAVGLAAWAVAVA